MKLQREHLMKGNSREWKGYHHIHDLLHFIFTQYTEGNVLIYKHHLSYIFDVWTYTPKYHTIIT